MITIHDHLVCLLEPWRYPENWMEKQDDEVEKPDGSTVINRTIIADNNPDWSWQVQHSLIRHLRIPSEGIGAERIIPVVKTTAPLLPDQKYRLDEIAWTIQEGNAVLHVHAVRECTCVMCDRKSWIEDAMHEHSFNFSFPRFGQ